MSVLWFKGGPNRLEDRVKGQRHNDLQSSDRPSQQVPAPFLTASSRPKHMGTGQSDAWQIVSSGKQRHPS